jgi:hypothetical protein
MTRLCSVKHFETVLHEILEDKLTKLTMLVNTNNFILLDTFQGNNIDSLNTSKT